MRCTAPVSARDAPVPAAAARTAALTPADQRSAFSTHNIGPAFAPSASSYCSRRRRSRTTAELQEMRTLLSNIVGGGDGAGECIDMLKAFFAGELGDADDAAVAAALEPLHQLVAATSSAASSARASDSSESGGDGGGAPQGDRVRDGSGGSDDSDGSDDSGSASDDSNHGQGYWRWKKFRNWPHSLTGGIAQAARLPPHPHHSEPKTVHCPPLAQLPPHECNCVNTHNYPACLIKGGGRLESFAELQMKEAHENVDIVERPTNKEHRFSCYRESFFILHSVGVKGTRIPLPCCVVAAIRRAWPEGSGIYTGFRAH